MKSEEERLFLLLLLFLFYFINCYEVGYVGKGSPVRKNKENKKSCSNVYFLVIYLFLFIKSSVDNYNIFHILTNTSHIKQVF